MTEITEQQQHLVNLINQRTSLSQEIETLGGQIGSRKELFFKVQGVIEYLTQIGVVIPEPEETVDEVSDEY